MTYKVIKRILDVIIAGTVLIAFLPILATLCLAIKIFIKGKIFFVQPRPGLHGKIFNMIKFKTMHDLRDSRGVPLPDEQRMSSFGNLLRKLSLDELPELINVIKGDMSLVGPRPLLVEYLPLYTPDQARRHLVQPGITGLAQISGRNNLEWEKRFQLDVYYVDNMSFSLDLKILFLTFFRVLKAKDVAKDGHVTMSKFEGKKDKV